jgi:hypothetical protein
MIRGAALTIVLLASFSGSSLSQQQVTRGADEQPNASAHVLESVLTQPVSELQEAVKGLDGLDPAGRLPPGGMEGLLRQVGVEVEEFFRDFSSTAATELVRQTRLDKKGRPRGVRSEEFYYLFLHRPGTDGGPWLDEYRSDSLGHLADPGGLGAGYMVTSGFATGLIVFHPRIQPGMSFRFLGRQKLAGHPACVIAFAQRPKESKPLGIFRTSLGTKRAELYLQGIAWISIDQHQVLRLRSDLLHPVPEVQLTRETTEIDYRPHRFSGSPKVFYLPDRVIVSVDWANKQLRNEHILSGFKLFKVEAGEQSPARRVAPPDKPAADQ